MAFGVRVPEEEEEEVTDNHGATNMAIVDDTCFSSFLTPRPCMTISLKAFLLRLLAGTARELTVMMANHKPPATSRSTAMHTKSFLSHCVAAIA